jgi:hypothetical protein
MSRLYYSPVAKRANKPPGEREGEGEKGTKGLPNNSRDRWHVTRIAFYERETAEV